MSCAFCDQKPHYRDRTTGLYVCPEHARLNVVALASTSTARPLTIRPAALDDLARIEELALHFWDETVVDCFGREYDVLTCPALLACEGLEVVGLAPHAVEAGWEAMVLVLLNVLPDSQGQGAGRLLLGALHDIAAQQGLGRMIVATTNDDLPALALYQRYGFHISGIVPGGVARHHGGELPGFSGIPIRDEIQLEYRLEG
jgi:GNAT superfamily N-acetyltransferase